MAITLTSCTFESEDEASHSSYASSIVITGLDSVDPDIKTFLSRAIEKAQLNPLDGMVRGELALSYEVNGYHDAALATYQQATALSPDQFEWPYLLAHLSAKQGKFDAAFEWLDHALSLRPDYAAAWLTKGFWLMDQHQSEAARVAFSKAEEHGGGAAATVGLARVHIVNEEWQDAVDLLQPVTKVLNHPYIYRLLGTALRQVDIDASRVAFSKARQDLQLTWPDEFIERRSEYIAGFAGRLKIASDLVTVEEFEAALPILEELTAIRPDHTTLNNLLGISYSRTNREDLAIETLRNSLENTPEFLPPYITLARILHDRGLYYSALRILDQAIAIMPSFGEAHERRSVVLIRMDRHADALKSIQRAIATDARKPSTFVTAGILEMSFRRWDHAVVHFETAISLDSTLVQAYVMLARCLGELGRIDEAEKVLDAAMDFDIPEQELSLTRRWLSRRVELNK